MNILSDREAAVLKTLVHSYIKEGKPVGSRHLTQKYGFDLSSATVRNVMSDLEQSGYIAQPHSSAGRIPTDKGYRYYFNDIMRLYEAAFKERQKLETLYENRTMEIDAILTYSSHLLAKISKQMGVVIAPSSDYLIIKKVELINLGDGEIMAVFISRSKMVMNRRMQLPDSITNDELAVINSFLNETIIGYGFHQINERIQEKIVTISHHLHELKKRLQLIGEQSLGIEESKKEMGEVIVDGIKNLVTNRDQLEPGKIEGILDLIEEKEKLRDLVSRTLLHEGVQAIIGNEMENEEFRGCSIITSSYKMADKNVGVLGIIGPKRMEYDKAIPLVDNISQMVSILLEKMSK